jgi:hypothetical protein
VVNQLQGDQLELAAMDQLGGGGAAGRAPKAADIIEDLILEATRAEDDDRLLLDNQARSFQKRSLHTQFITKLQRVGYHPREGANSNQGALDSLGCRLEPRERLARDLDESLGNRQLMHLERADRGAVAGTDGWEHEDAIQSETATS